MQNLTQKWDKKRAATKMYFAP